MRLLCIAITHGSHITECVFCCRTGSDSDSTATPPTTSLSGSFVDEGLDLSQRLTGSMFTGPELDPAAREVVSLAGSRVAQAIGRLLDMLEATVKQVTAGMQ